MNELTLEKLVDFDAFASEFGDQLNERLEMDWQYSSIGEQMRIRAAVKASLRAALRVSAKKQQEGTSDE